MSGGEDASFGGLALESGWELRLEPNPSDRTKLQVALYDTRGDTEERVETEKKPRTFYTSTQHVGEVGNLFRDAVADAAGSADGESIKEAFSERCSHLAEKGDEVEEALAMKLASETAARVQRETEKVVFKHSAGESLVRVKLTSEVTDITDEVELSSGAFNNNSPEAVKKAYFDATADRIDLSGQDWCDIRTYWESIRTVERDNDVGEWEHIAERMAEGLDLHVSAERDTLKTGKQNAWFQPDPPDRWAGDDGGGVLWVRSPALTDQMSEAGRSVNNLSRAKEALAEMGYLRDTDRTTRHGKAVYGFVPEALDANPEAVGDGGDGDGDGADEGGAVDL